MQYQPFRRSGINHFAMVMLQAIAVYCVLLPVSDAWATTVGDVITGGAKSYNTLPRVMNYMSFIAGLIVIISGIQKIKQHVDRPDQVPVSHGLWHIAGGIFLMSLPQAWGMLVRSFALATASGSTVNASNIALKVIPGVPISLDVMMVRFISNVRGPLQLLLWTLSAVLGLFFLITAFLRMARGAAQDGPRGSLGSGTLTRIIIGSVLLSLASTADVFTSTLFGGGIVKFDGMAIPGIPTSELDQINQAVAAILIFIQIVGFIAFIRGFLMLRALADANTSVSAAAAFTHVLGGAVAINISPMLSALQKTFCDTGCAVINFS